VVEQTVLAVRGDLDRRGGLALDADGGVPSLAGEALDVAVARGRRAGVDERLELAVERALGVAQRDAVLRTAR
jgi:hypothetical protein